MFIFQSQIQPPKILPSESVVPKNLAISSIGEFQKVSSQNAPRDALINQALEIVRGSERKNDPNLYKPEAECRQFNSNAAYSKEEAAKALGMYNDLASNETYVKFVESIYAKLDKEGRLVKDGKKPTLEEFTKKYIVRTVAILTQEIRNFSDSSDAKKVNKLEVDAKAQIYLCNMAACLGLDIMGELKTELDNLRHLHGKGLQKGLQNVCDHFFGPGSYEIMGNVLDALYKKWFGKDDETQDKLLSAARENMNMGFIAYVQQNSAAGVDERNRGKTDFC